MESGQNRLNTTLLTIAIPTWNRAEYLMVALDYLLPQISMHSNLIELVISDNASNDNTQEVISNKLSNFPLIKSELFLQDKNIGFFGNFHKCISLATSKYLWLLSDDDYVSFGVIDKIIELLKKEDVGAILLNYWAPINNYIKYEYVNHKYFFSNQPHRLSLISNIVYKNCINGDDEIFESLKNNALIGYVVFLKAIHKYDNFVVLKGDSLIGGNDKSQRFNGLHIFTIDLAACLNYAKLYYSKKIIRNITNDFLNTNIKTYYKYQKYGNMPNEDNNLKIFKKYLTRSGFWRSIFPIIICPKILFELQRKLRKLPLAK